MTAFPSIRLEGGLLGPDVLETLADLPGQKPADFGLEPRRNLTDEIAALFADARALWGVFQNRRARLREGDPATTVTRDWVVPLLGLLGYELSRSKAYEVDGLSFAISHRAGEGEDAPPVHIVGAGQSLGRVAASGRPRLAPHSLVQEYLNRTDHVWGLVTNGLTLRLLRDSTFIRRQAYVEFDLQALLEEQRFEDFVALYRLLHRTRLPRELEDSSDCLLEKYRAHSEEQGGRVREHLREGVEKCITLLANGFLRHPANDDLRQRVARSCTSNARITADNLYRQLLRLVYRFLFLLVSEDRGLLSHDPLYRDHYSIGRLRRLLDHRRAAFSDHDDLWQSLRVLWQVLADERFAHLLGLAPLNGELFSPQDIDQLTLTNNDLLEAFWHLAWYQEGRSSPRRVNYAALDVEELGSVYESLLEFHPAVEEDTAGRPFFQLLTGSERKTTGSYYTPPQLVAELIKSALEPVLADRLAAHPKDPEKAILSIRVCDPACGSGHFLLAAARRLGKELARVRSGDEEPPPERVREAVRDVISHCIYGVDKNPLAVDLCRVALWLESHTEDKPLTFLDHRIRLGDSLVGVFNPTMLAEGIPDEAFKPLEGDDKATARSMAKRNRQEREGQMHLGLVEWAPEVSLVDFTLHSREVDAISDDSPEAIRRKRQLFEKSHDDPAWRRQQVACDLWTAAFFQPLSPGASAITSGAVADHLSGRPIDARVKASAEALSQQQSFFHWRLEFPEVFEDGGFDVVLSNPPWEQVELKEQEFFAARDARIASAPTKAERSRLIDALRGTNPSLDREYSLALRAFNAARTFLAQAGRFPLTGRGRINTYAVFAELCRELIGPDGRSGIVIPSGIAFADTTKLFFEDLIRSEALVSLFSFFEIRQMFPATDSRDPFCLFTVRGASRDVPEVPEFVFNAKNVGDLYKNEKRFTLSVEEILLLNPNTKTCPTFQSRHDAELIKAIYRRMPILFREGVEEGNPWQAKFFQGLFNMASDSGHFQTAEALTLRGYRLEGNVFLGAHDRYLPLYEAKMLHQFDHRWATYVDATTAREVTMDEKEEPTFVTLPRYWVQEEIVEAAIPQFPEPIFLALQLEHRPSLQYLLCWWAAGFYLNRHEPAMTEELLRKARTFELDSAVARCLGNGRAESLAAELEQKFPLTREIVTSLDGQLHNPESLGRDLVSRFSPKWLLAYRRVCRTTDERSGIFTAMPLAAVGDSEFLMILAGVESDLQLALLAALNSLCFDYVVRQKVGGANFNFFIIKQLPVLAPAAVQEGCPFDAESSSRQWSSLRVLELVYSASDLTAMARCCGYSGLPFPWNEARRFEIRCELDAAFFHLYLPSDMNGRWRQAERESPEQLAVLRSSFPTPRDAVAFILDQFPLVRQKDEKEHGRYRTKDRILEIYDAMLEAQRTGRPYQTTLNPPPGVQP